MAIGVLWLLYKSLTLFDPSFYVFHLEHHLLIQMAVSAMCILSSVSVSYSMQAQ